MADRSMLNAMSSPENSISAVIGPTCSATSGGTSPVSSIDSVYRPLVTSAVF